MAGLNSSFMANPHKKGNIVRNTVLIDATELSPGRIASQVATILRGKNKPSYTPHSDCGDFVVIINVDKIKITGKKLQQKTFYWHTGYAGGIKSRTWEKMSCTEIMQNAVRRMMPKESPLARKQLTRLKIYPSSEHPHNGQQPITYKVATKPTGKFSAICPMTGNETPLSIKGFSA